MTRKHVVGSSRACRSVYAGSVTGGTALGGGLLVALDLPRIDSDHEVRRVAVLGTA
jgi:hypothetical protein